MELTTKCHSALTENSDLLQARRSKVVVKSSSSSLPTANLSLFLFLPYFFLLPTALPLPQFSSIVADDPKPKHAEENKEETFKPMKEVA